MYFVRNIQGQQWRIMGGGYFVCNVHMLYPVSAVVCRFRECETKRNSATHTITSASSAVPNPYMQCQPGPYSKLNPIFITFQIVKIHIDQYLSS